MYKKLIFVISLFGLPYGLTRAEFQHNEIESENSIDLSEDVELSFSDFDQPELPSELIETAKPSALVRFLAKGYPLFVWCVFIKKSIADQMVAVKARLNVIKNRLKGWFNGSGQDARCQ